MMQKTTTLQLLKNKPVNLPNSVYKDIWLKLNYVLTQNLIESGGQPIKLAPFFGEIKIIRVKKKPKLVNGKLNYPVNWSKTRQLRKEGKIGNDKVVYSMYPFSYRFVWSGRNFKGSSAYTFKASRTNGTTCKIGVVNRLIGFITENDTNYLKFPLI